MAPPRLAPSVTELRRLPAGDRIVRLRWLVNDHRTALARLSIGPPHPSTERRRRRHEQAWRMLGNVTQAFDLRYVSINWPEHSLAPH